MNRNQAAKQQVTKNQHYIPQFLLRQTLQRAKTDRETGC